MGADPKGWREIEFIAQGESEAGIEFYAWDWAYAQEKNVFKPEILRDKEGRQTHKFKSGMHCVAVKVVDNDGLENMDVIRLKVNGIVEQELPT